jgi:fumarate hydratase subunit alpha
MTREIASSAISESVARLAVEANQLLGRDVVEAFEGALEKETSPAGRDILAQLLENARLAREDSVPMCQDTGLAVVFLEVGQDLHIAGSLEEAVQEGIRQGYRDGYLRRSIVRSPIGERKNTGDNTPAIIHTTIVPGENLKITVAPKGGGSENMSALRMLKPADGWAGAREFILETVTKAGPNPCPPLVVGVGLGGNFEMSALLAKKALLRTVGERNADQEIAARETELLEALNGLGIGPAGFGGEVTVLGVHIETHPCHIASLPVAVNINCHAHRHREAVL